MKINCKTFWLPKRGNTAQEYEDAAWPCEALETEAGQFKCAIADGATECSFSDRWAQLLVKGFVEGTEFSVLTQSWHDQIKDLELPWYAQEKAEVGAFSTLLGLSLIEDEEKRLRFEVSAIGDSCVLHSRNGAMIESYPLSEASQFNNAPRLVPSLNISPDQFQEMIALHQGDFQAGDRFFLLTDAIACWTLKRQSTKGDALEILNGIAEQQRFESIVNQARDEHDEEGRAMMRNDDVTLISVEVAH